MSNPKFRDPPLSNPFQQFECPSFVWLGNFGMGNPPSPLLAKNSPFRMITPCIGWEFSKIKPCWNRWDPAPFRKQKSHFFLIWKLQIGRDPPHLLLEFFQRNKFSFMPPLSCEIFLAYLTECAALKVCDSCSNKEVSAFPSNVHKGKPGQGCQQKYGHLPQGTSFSCNKSCQQSVDKL